MKKIELTGTSSGYKFYALNPKNIFIGLSPVECVTFNHKTESVTHINLITGGYWTVMESPEEILKLIEESEKT